MNELLAQARKLFSAVSPGRRCTWCELGKMGFESLAVLTLV